MKPFLTTPLPATLIKPPSPLHLDYWDRFQLIFLFPPQISFQFKCHRSPFSTSDHVCWKPFSDFSSHRVKAESRLWPVKPRTIQAPWLPFLFFSRVHSTRPFCPYLLPTRLVTSRCRASMLALPSAHGSGICTLSFMLLFQWHLLHAGHVYSHLKFHLPWHLAPWLSLPCCDFSSSPAFVTFSHTIYYVYDVCYSLSTSTSRI